jgi:hypothetical protein
MGEFNLDGVVVEQFGGAVAGDFVHFVEAFPGESDRRPAMCDVEAGELFSDIGEAVPQAFCAA